MWGRKRKWWELTHSKDSVRPSIVGFALQELKSGLWPARFLVIVRVGQPGSAPRVWIGTSAENDHVVAKHVAEAAGCVPKRCASRLGSPEHPTRGSPKSGLTGLPEIRRSRGPAMNISRVWPRPWTLILAIETRSS